MTIENNENNENNVSESAGKTTAKKGAKKKEAQAPVVVPAHLTVKAFFEKAIKNLIHLKVFFDVVNGNPNGDPDNDNLPRHNPQTGIGLVTSGAIKRKIRDAIIGLMEGKRGYKIHVAPQANLNVSIAKAYEETLGRIPDKSRSDEVGIARAWLCSEFFDIRAFGAVLSTGANAGQVMGPISVVSANSIDPIDVDSFNMAITCVAKADGKGASTELQENFDALPESQRRNMGSKKIIPYGLYAFDVFITPFNAEKTGFSEEDYKVFVTALSKMFDFNRTDSKGFMSVRKIIEFRHVGVDGQSGRFGCCQAHKLLELGEVISVKNNVGENPRKFSDYTITIDETKVPAGVKMTKVLD